MTSPCLPILTPMLAHTAEPFSSFEYLYEPKWDGFRCLAYAENSATKLLSRRGVDLSPNFPELTMLHSQVKEPPAILDGEIVIFDGAKEQFQLLLQRMRKGPQQTPDRDVPALFVVFDLLYSKGVPLLDMPLQERKNRLTEGVSINDYMVINSYIVEAGKALFDAAVAQGREGIMAKRLQGQYLPGKRSREWLKIKPLITTEATVIGYIPKGPNAFTSLALGQYLATSYELIYIGNVGTGFTEADMGEILTELKTLTFSTAEPTSAMSKGCQSMIWVKPQIVIEVRYLKYTPTGSLRHPSYIRRRYDVLPEECLFPQPEV